MTDEDGDVVPNARSVAFRLLAMCLGIAVGAGFNITTGGTVGLAGGVLLFVFVLIVAAGVDRWVIEPREARR